MECVVNDKDVAKLVGWSFFHELWSNVLDNEDIREADENRGKGRGHKEPIVHSNISMNKKKQLNESGWDIQYCTLSEKEFLPLLDSI